LRSTIARTRDNTGMTVILAVSYGGRDDILRATRAIARQVARGEMDPQTIDADTVAAHLGTAGIPDPDLLIPTTGAMRISTLFPGAPPYRALLVTAPVGPASRGRESPRALAFSHRPPRRFGRTAEQTARERLRAAN